MVELKGKSGYSSIRSKDSYRIMKKLFTWIMSGACVGIVLSTLLVLAVSTVCRDSFSCTALDYFFVPGRAVFHFVVWINYSVLHRPPFVSSTFLRMTMVFIANVMIGSFVGAYVYCPFALAYRWKWRGFLTGALIACSYFILTIAVDGIFHMPSESILGGFGDIAVVLNLPSALLLNGFLKIFSLHSMSSNGIFIAMIGVTDVMFGMLIGWAIARVRRNMHGS